MEFEWNNEKNTLLKEERDICFEDIVIAINDNVVVDIIDHPNQDSYPSQKIYIVEVNGYVYMVPFTKQDETIFLKTIIPSRKMKKRYRKE